jgi:2-polyprenyl-6-hydroxyphenyl methylase/3-demethylubiquinone-9 3-methyltransferase
MNPVRIGYMVDIVQKQTGTTTLNDLTALDVGCGGGLLSESLARLGAHVTAIDPSQALVDVAKNHGKTAGDPRLDKIDYQGGISVEELASQQQQQYDVVCLLEVVEHATNVKSLVEAASSLVKPDTGVLFVSTINRTWKSYLLTIVGAEYVMGYIPKGTHDWNQYLSPEEVSEVMDKCGMERIDASGMVLSKPPLFGNWDWRIDPNDTDVNWIGAFRRKGDS